MRIVNDRFLRAQQGLITLQVCVCVCFAVKEMDAIHANQMFDFNTFDSNIIFHSQEAYTALLHQMKSVGPAVDKMSGGAARALPNATLLAENPTVESEALCRPNDDYTNSLIAQLQEVQRFFTGLSCVDPICKFIYFFIVCSFYLSKL